MRSTCTHLAGLFSTLSSSPTIPHSLQPSGTAIANLMQRQPQLKVSQQFHTPCMSREYCSCPVFALAVDILDMPVALSVHKGNFFPLATERRFPVSAQRGVLSKHSLPPQAGSVQASLYCPDSQGPVGIPSSTHPCAVPARSHGVGEFESGFTQQEQRFSSWSPAFSCRTLQPIFCLFSRPGAKSADGVTPL